MYHTQENQYCTISFDTNEDMNRAFFELIHNSSDGFTGISVDTINITKEQCEMLEGKNINYNHINEDLSATT